MVDIWMNILKDINCGYMDELKDINGGYMDEYIEGYQWWIYG